MSSDRNHVYLQYYWRLYILSSYIRIIVSQYKRTVLKVLLPVRGVGCEVPTMKEMALRYLRWLLAMLVWVKL